MVSGLSAPSAAQAHRLRPAVVTITLNPDRTYVVTIQLNMEAVLAGIGPEHQDTSESPNAATYDALREMPPTQLQARISAFADRYLAGVGLLIDGRPLRPRLVDASVPEVGDPARERLTTLTLAGESPPGAATLTWTYASELGSSAVRILRAGEETMQTAFLNPGETSPVFEIGKALQPKATPQIYREYIRLGFTHILPKGLDHILFVLGIFLLSVRVRPLLYQVTAFTLAHTITLGLSLYGVISLSPAIVEPLIALSIVYVGVENMLTAQLKPWRVFVVFGFGLLHGMGFAGVLVDIGLPEGEYLNALIAFNLGVEFGQIAVIAGAFATFGAWFRNRDWYRVRIVIPGSLAISVVGAYWAVERVLG